MEIVLSASVPVDFEQYAAGYPPDVRRRLREMRAAVRAAAPDATEVISYRMPAFRLGRILVWFGAFTNHIGLYPGVAAMKKFSRELSSYTSAKGSVQFPFDRPLPLDVVAEIVRFRVAEERTRE
jgi:uncharacterized protein YdhG (YjbR/CyaY superfamily)